MALGGLRKESMTLGEFREETKNLPDNFHLMVSYYADGFWVRDFKVDEIDIIEEDKEIYLS